MRILIADDHPLYREAVRLRMERLYPGSAIVEASSIDELLAGSDPNAADLALVDLRMPGMNGPGDVARIRSGLSGTPILLMSGSAANTDIKLAVEAGAKGFVPKTLSPELFAAAVALVLAGGTYLPTDVLQHNAGGDGTRRMTLTADLTPREMQVFVQLATGASNKEIGRELGLAEVTVKLHVRQILKKIGARNRSEAASIATRAGLI
jgi:two-component system, NarL family, nitrate/nitrite response regulator NarL